MIMKKCVIVGGAEIKEKAYIKSLLSKEDFYIFCDRGLDHLDMVREVTERDPDLSVGDFDSHREPSEGEVIKLPREKDDTDTFYAVKEGIKRGFDNFLLIGMIGERIDHTLGNISILLYLFERGKKAVCADDYCEMLIVGQTFEYIEDSYQYFSLLNVCGTAKDIIIRDAKFPLEGGEIKPDYQYGVSNEVLPGKKACVSVGEGNLLLTKIR